VSDKKIFWTSVSRILQTRFPVNHPTNGVKALKEKF